MSEELDRKVAELVMGEPEPPMKADSERGYYKHWWDEERRYWSAGGNWMLDAPAWRWVPLPFSTNLDQAMRAWHEKFGDDERKGLLLEHYYDHREQRWLWKARNRSFLGSDLGEPDKKPGGAVCNLLLALVEEKH